MSENLQRNKDFVKLLITTTQTQVKALLSTVTPAQVQCLVEIAYNLIDTDQFQSLHHRQKKLLEYLANLSVNDKRKKPVLIKHRVLLIKVLKNFRDILEAL